MKKFSIMLICLIIVSLIFFCSCTQTSNENINTQLSSESASSEVSESQSSQSRITVVTGTDYLGAFNDAIFTEDDLYVSELLKETIENYKSKDVIFKIIVELPYDEEEREKCFNFAVESGADNIKAVSSLSSSDISSFFNSGFVMNVSADTLSKMIEHRGYILLLAPPERINGYSRQISDSLTVEIDEKSEDENIHVAVVCRVDKNNEYLSLRDIPHSNYNSDLSLDWSWDKLDDAAVSEYIDTIVERNGLTEKRVINPEYSDSDFTIINENNYYINMAGFEVNLTKADILELAKDPDIKAIYPMEKYKIYCQ